MPTYYVSTTGSDASGTPTNINTPWRTIGHAATAMVAGDTTYVRGGIYSTENTIRFTVSGTSSNRIQLLSYPGESPVVSWSSRTDALKRIYLYSGSLTTPISDITIRGFDFYNGYEGLKVEMGLRIIVQANIFRNHYDNGILGTCFNGTIDRNIFYANGDYTQSDCAGSPLCNKFHGMYLTGTGWTITNNLVYDNLAYGIQAAGYPYVAGAFPSASYAGFSGVIANNTICYNRNRAGITIWQNGAVSTIIENNILYENSQAITGNQGIDFVSAGSGHIVRNNLHYGTGSTGFTAGTGGWTESNNINLPPSMINAPATVPGSPNFHLNAGSPAIGTGFNVTGIVTTDFTGVTRTAPFDIGAYKTSTVIDVTPPATPTGLQVI